MQPECDPPPRPGALPKSVATQRPIPPLSETRKPSLKLKGLLNVLEAGFFSNTGKATRQLRASLSGPSARRPEPPGPPVYPAGEWAPGLARGRVSLAFCTFPKPHNPKKSHPQLLDPKGSPKAQMENFVAPAMTTWVTGSAAGGRPDPWLFPTTQVCSHCDPEGTRGATREAGSHPPVP